MFNKWYSNGHICATGCPIHFMFVYRVGFSATADLMALFSIRINSRWQPPPSWIFSNGHISATAHDLLIYRASRGHLCDSTAFLLSLAMKAHSTRKAFANLFSAVNLVHDATVKQTRGSTMQLWR